MTEITRVPLQPIGRGALSRLWLGVAAAVLVAGGVAWASIPPSVDVQTIKAGEGPHPTTEDVALINYVGHLPNGKVFDQAKQAVFPVTGVIPGFTKALQQMQRGGKYKVEIPSQLAYGHQQAGPIPPNTDLTFDVELIDFRSRAEIERQQQLIQQLQQMQGAQGGQSVPGAAGPGQVAPGGEEPAAPPSPQQ